MAQIISISIDLTAIDKAKIVPHENGKKYYTLNVAINDEKDRFDNDCSVWEGQTKQERDEKAPKNYLGNGRIIWSKEPTQKPAPAAQQPQETVNYDDIPF